MHLESEKPRIRLEDMVEQDSTYINTSTNSYKTATNQKKGFQNFESKKQFVKPKIQQYQTNRDSIEDNEQQPSNTGNLISLLLQVISIIFMIRFFLSFFKKSQ